MAIVIPDEAESESHSVRQVLQAAPPVAGTSLISSNGTEATAIG